MPDAPARRSCAYEVIPMSGLTRAPSPRRELPSRTRSCGPPVASRLIRGGHGPSPRRAPSSRRALRRRRRGEAPGAGPARGHVGRVLAGRSGVVVAEEREVVAFAGELPRRPRRPLPRRDERDLELPENIGTNLGSSSSQRARPRGPACPARGSLTGVELGVHAMERVRRPRARRSGSPTPPGSGPRYLGEATDAR